MPGHGRTVALRSTIYRHSNTTYTLMTGRMRLRMGGILALVLVMTGCTQTREISQEEIARDGAYSFSEGHQTLEAKEVEREQTAERTMPTIGLRSDSDST